MKEHQNNISELKPWQLGA